MKDFNGSAVQGINEEDKVKTSAWEIKHFLEKDCVNLALMAYKLENEYARELFIKLIQSDINKALNNTIVKHKWVSDYSLEYEFLISAIEEGKSFEEIETMIRKSHIAMRKSWIDRMVADMSDIYDAEMYTRNKNNTAGV